MKTIKILILVIFLIGIIGCESNPINPVETETDKCFKGYAKISVVQEYGYCDTLCYGLGITLYENEIPIGIAVIDKFRTGADSILFNNRMVGTNCFYITYESNMSGYYIIDNIERGFEGIGKDTLYLKYNTNYSIQYSING